MTFNSNPHLYFPNLVFTMIRSAKEAGRRANEVCFRVPMIMNKLDIKNYLKSLYGISVRNVETKIFLMKERGAKGIPPSLKRKKGSYKNAIVTLDNGDKFKYPEEIPFFSRTIGKRGFESIRRIPSYARTKIEKDEWSKKRVEDLYDRLSLGSKEAKDHK